MARNMFWARGISKEKAKGEETPPPGVPCVSL